MTDLTPTAKAVRAFVPSPQQQAFFDWIINGTGSCILQAVAGAGKTTTLIEAIRFMRGSIFLGAYSKDIATEIQSRAPKRDWLHISTMHAAGFQAWRRVARNVKVDGNKLKNIFRSSKAVPMYEHLEDAVCSLVEFAKQTAIGVLHSANDNSAWLNIIEHFDVDCMEDERTVITLAKKLLERSIEQNYDVVDFHDMIYAPLYHKVRVTEYDWVLLDEAQDTNASRRALALRMMKRGGRMVAVGDKHQAIFGFTGADSDALELIREATSAVELPLSVTYRCPKKVVEFARQYVSHITAHESAPDGEVIHIASDVRLTTVVKPGDAILCRFNAPLITRCLQFIAEGIPAKVEGRNIGANLKKLAQRWKVKTFTALSDKLEQYKEREVAKYRAKEQESKAVAVEDMVACVNVIIDRCLKLDPSQDNPVKRIITEIDKIFGDDVGHKVVVLASIHKSKGREWDTVLWLQTGPSRWARKEWEHDQENNLCYVAPTRAKRTLILQAIPN